MKTRGTLALTGLALGAAAPLAGTPFAARPARVDVVELARIVERQDDHISALELAQWIRQRRPGLRVIDLRPQSDYDELHVPGAERIPLESLATMAFPADDTVVLYSAAGAHAGQGWVFLQALGHRQAFFLRGGIYEWMDQVLSPALAIDATDQERAAFARAAEISRYFGGTPRTGVPRSEIAATMAQVVRKGC